MGIGFVLLLWAVLISMLAVPAWLLISCLGRRTGGPQRSTRLTRWFALAFFGGGAYALAAFMAYWLWCENCRGVDCGIGDSWLVPVGHGYEMNMIDTPDNASLRPAGLEGEAIISGIDQIGEYGQYVFGHSASNGWFLFDTSNRTLQQDKNQMALLLRLRPLGIAETATIPVREFYMAKRWSWMDALAVILLGAPAAVVAIWTLRKAWGATESLPADGDRP